MDIKVRDGETFLCIGDSITDCGRMTEPSGLGNGYVKIFNDLLTAEFAQKKIKVINKGTSGNTVFDLRMRWEDDVIYHKPDWLSIMIGINDTSRTLSRIEGWETFKPENYLNDYRCILKRVKEELNCPIVLIEPFFITTDRTDNYREKMLNLLQDYRKIVWKLSEEFQTSLIKLHDVFQNCLKYCDAETFCPEPVHPNLTGHNVIAWQLFKALLK